MREGEPLKTSLDTLYQLCIPEAKQILLSNLQDIPAPERAFDLGYINYKINNVDTRIRNIVEQITSLILKKVTPIIEKEKEVEIRNKIRRSI